MSLAMILNAFLKICRFFQAGCANKNDCYKNVVHFLRVYQAELKPSVL